MRLTFATILCCALASVVLAEDKPESVIPLDKLDAQASARLRQVIPGYTFYRKVGLQRARAHARYDIIEYLINNLDQTSIVALPLKIVEYRSKRMPDGAYFADNRKGSVGYLWPLYAAPGQRLYFAQGSDREGKNVEGKAVVLLSYHQKSPGVVEFEMHAFVKVESWLKRVLAKIFLPLVTGTVDKRFGEVLDVPVLVAEEVQKNPKKVLGLIGRMSPEDQTLLEEFRQLILKQ